MELGPISGIRSVTLLSSGRAEKGDTPLFAIDASASAGDEPGSSGQQPPDRDSDPDQDYAQQEQPTGIEIAVAGINAEVEQDRREIPYPGSHDWFV